ncbi:MAG: hypothetical protein LBG71_00210 [Clostridiales Family XIII bacterium]|jgi:hypothetical protein|nr:hypothetical protein [Clostridiales Family XIII bacterium]
MREIYERWEDEKLLKLLPRMVARCRAASGENASANCAAPGIMETIEVGPIARSRLSLLAVIFKDVFLEGEALNISGVVFKCPYFKRIDRNAPTYAACYAVVLDESEGTSVAIEGESFKGESRSKKQNLYGLFFRNMLQNAYLQAGVDYLKEEIQKHEPGDPWISDSFGPGYYGLGMDAMFALEKLLDFDKVGARIRGDGIMFPALSRTGFFLALNEKPATDSRLDACASCEGRTGGCIFCDKNTIVYSKRHDSGLEFSRCLSIENMVHL